MILNNASQSNSQSSVTNKDLKDLLGDSSSEEILLKDTGMISPQEDIAKENNQIKSENENEIKSENATEIKSENPNEIEKTEDRKTLTTSEQILLQQVLEEEDDEINVSSLLNSVLLKDTDELKKSLQLVKTKI